MNKKRNRENPSVTLSENEVVYSCRILDALAESFDRVAAQPELMPQLHVELMQKWPEILNALLSVTRKDCRVVTFDLGKSALRLMESCLRQKKPKKK